MWCDAMREDDQRDMGQPEAECKFRVAFQAKPFLIGENYMRVNNSFCGCVAGPQSGKLFKLTDHWNIIESKIIFN